MAKTGITHHEVAGHNFHGRYVIVLWGAEQGFELSEGQTRKVNDKLCPRGDCKCRGSLQYGGIDPNAARVVRRYNAKGEEVLSLIPAPSSGVEFIEGYQAIA